MRISCVRGFGVLGLLILKCKTKELTSSYQSSLLRDLTKKSRRKRNTFHLVKDQSNASSVDILKDETRSKTKERAACATNAKTKIVRASLEEIA